MVVLSALFSSSYSYSETVYGTTGNAASDAAYNWVMQNVLPQQAGLEVTGVIYRYTAVKDPESDMVVYVQNEDAQNPGQYIFREKDDWSGLEGKPIYKVIPQPNVLIDRWGDGSIEVEGEGSVEDASVTYNYQFDPCFDPQSSPECPGYVPEIPDIPEPDLTSIYEENDRFIEENEKNKEIDPEDLDEDEENRDRKRVQQIKKERLEVALGAVNSALLTADAQQKHSELMALSIIPTNYTVQTIPQTVYDESVTLIDKKLPDNKKARRVSFAQQLLHEEMVESQYKKGEQ